MSPHMSSQYGELQHTSGWDLMSSLGHRSTFQRVSRLGSITARHSTGGRQPNFAALNRGRHLYSAVRPSRWAMADTVVIFDCIGLPSVTLAVVQLKDLLISSSVWAMSHQPSRRPHRGTTLSVASTREMSQTLLRSTCSVPATWRRHTDTSSCSFRTRKSSWRISANWKCSYAVGCFIVATVTHCRCAVNKALQAACFLDRPSWNSCCKNGLMTVWSEFWILHNRT